MNDQHAYFADFTETGFSITDPDTGYQFKDSFPFILQHVAVDYGNDAGRYLRCQYDENANTVLVETINIKRRSYNILTGPYNYTQTEKGALIIKNSSEVSSIMKSCYLSFYFRNYSLPDFFRQILMEGVLKDTLKPVEPEIYAEIRNNFNSIITPFFNIQKV